MNWNDMDTEGEFVQREIEEYIDAKPKKRIILNKAMRCSFRNAMAEIVDNCLDYWVDLERPRDLIVEIGIEKQRTDDSTATVKWNMGVPRERWRPLLTPGDVMHRSASSIGVWGEGFKIAAFATGRVIDIMTNDGGKMNQIHIPDEFLSRDDWKIAVYKGVEEGASIPEDHTLLRLRGEAYNEHPVDVYPLVKHLAETFGTRMREEEADGHRVSITVNGEEVKPITFGLPQDIATNYAFPPGFEPSEHLFHEDGLEIRMIVGLLHTMDSENYGVFMYGNGRLFASRLRNDVVGFGTRANSPIPADHPHAKRIQIHVFFMGNPDKIPWQAPLKDSLIVQHPVINRVADYIKKYAAPYAHYMKSAKTPEIVTFSTKWNAMDEERRMKEMFTGPEKKQLSDEELEEKWKALPDSVRGDFELPKTIETWDHGPKGRGRKPSDSPKFDRNRAKKVARRIKDRDSMKISTPDLVKELVDQSIGIDKRTKGTPVPATPREEGGEPPLFDTSEGSVTLSVRMAAKEANQLAYIVGERQKSILLKTIVERYKELHALKSHPFLQKKKKVWSDEELLEEIKSVLDAQE